MVTIESSQIFGALPPSDLALLRGAAEVRRFAPGQEIFREGDQGDGVYFLEDGRVEILGVLSGSRHQVLSHVEPGEVFGEMAVIEDLPRSAGARAVAHSLTQFVPQEQIRKLMETSTPVAMTLLREVSRRLREFNRQHLREVIQAERLAIVGRFARSVIHDLKNPLNVIGLTAEIAGMDQSTPEMRLQAVGSIRTQVDRIGEMITEILDFTQGTQTDLILLPIQYGDFVRGLLEEIRPEAELRSVTVELDGPLPDCEVLAHPKRLPRVFHNLVHNANDAMGEGGTLTVRVRTTPEEVITEFEDIGPGIAPEIAGSLFEPFSTHGKTAGTGLGLSICQRIIDDHRGWISGRNKPDRGAIFSFGLPLVRRTQPRHDPS